MKLHDYGHYIKIHIHVIILKMILHREINKYNLSHYYNKIQFIALLFIINHLKNPIIDFP